MQFKTFTLSALLLALPEAVFAADITYVRMSEMSGRDSFLNMQPQFFAEPVKEGGSLAKRQTCEDIMPGSTPCYEGCCKPGTVCGIYGGKKGCCEEGKTCNRVGGCQNPSDVYCKTYCCPEGDTCGVDSNGAETCFRGGNTCEVGFSPCADSNGCCPTGVRCIQPNSCDIRCTPSDPKCGTGCCPQGSYCTSDEKCAKLNKYTSLVATTTRVIYTRTIPSKTDYTLLDTTTTPDSTPDTTTDSKPDSTTDSKPDSTTDSTTEPSSTSSSTDYYPTTSRPTSSPRRTVTIQTLPPGTGAAPTMGAMLGGGLGMAAGVLGFFAM